MDQTREFLLALWPDTFDVSGSFVVSRLDRTANRMVPAWCSSVGDILAERDAHAERFDLYIGCCTQDRDAATADKATGRGSAKTATAMPGVWADIDIAGDAHKSDRLCPDIETAKALVRSAGVEPSIWVNSGHGVQAWWLFDEPWAFADDEDRNRAASLAASWVATIQAHAATKFNDVKVDSVGDLARVLRLPGTYNLKTTRRPVTAEFSTLRYAPSELEGSVYVPMRIDLGAPPVVPGECSPEAVEIARQCVSAMNDRRAEIYESWIKVGLTLKATGGETLRGLWHQFSRRSPKYDAGQADAKWDSFAPDRVSMGSLLAMAREDSGAAVAEADPEQVGAGWGDEPEGDAAGDAGGRSEAPKASPRPKSPDRSVRARVSNVIDTTFTDKEGKEHEVVYYRPLPSIDQAMREATGGWPRRAGSLLFAATGCGDVDRPHFRPVQWFGKPEQLFAYLMRDCDVRWHPGLCRSATTREKMLSPTKGEFFEYQKQNAEPVYSAVELLPHHPPVDDVFYIETPLPNWDQEFVSPLHELLERLNPETEMDRQLLLAALLTPGWGGPCGARPAFVLTSEHGRGSGKTTTVEGLSDLWGGHVGIGANEDMDTVRKRLLGDDSMTQRVVLIDNLKGKLNSADIESMITAGTIDGWKPYHGQARRPNRLTWFITANTPSLSRDLADRAVIIKIGKQKHGVDFKMWAAAHIKKYRGQILSELFSILRRPPRCKIAGSNRDRWQAWQDAVLSRLDDGDALAKLIVSRRPDVDSDLSDADEVATAIEQLFQDRQYLDFDGNKFFITNPAMHQNLVKAGVLDRSFSRRGMVTWLRDLCGTGRLSPVKYAVGSGNKKGWFYSGPMWDGSREIITIDELPYQP